MACAAQTCLAGVTFLCLLSSSRSAAHWLRLRLVLATVPCRRSDSTCKAYSQTLRSSQENAVLLSTHANIRRRALMEIERG